MKSYNVIHNHVISWVLMPNHRFNLSESTGNDKNQQQQIKNLFFNFSLKIRNQRPRKT